MTFVGKGGAGKSSTLRSLLGFKFDPEYILTVVGDVGMGAAENST